MTLMVYDPRCRGGDRKQCLISRWCASPRPFPVPVTRHKGATGAVASSSSAAVAIANDLTSRLEIENTRMALLNTPWLERKDPFVIAKVPYCYNFPSH